MRSRTRSSVEEARLEAVAAEDAAATRASTYRVCPISGVTVTRRQYVSPGGTELVKG